MDSKKSRPYLIELYSGQNKLQNKFKFILGVKHVKELKLLIIDKLLHKGEIQKDVQLIIKDHDDYELASDDEIQDVIPDAKVRIYQKIKHTQVNVVNIPPTLTTTIPTFPKQPLPTVSPSNLIPPTFVHVIDPKNLVLKNTILDLQKLTIPIISQEVKLEMILFCPQIQVPAIKLPFDYDIDSYLNLSRYIIKMLGLDPSLKALLYNKRGQPLIYCLDLMHMQLPKFNFSEPFYAVFTNSPSITDQQVIQPLMKCQSQTDISIITGKNSFILLDIDLNNIIEVLKYKIFEITHIHPKNQILEYNDKNLDSSTQTLKQLGLKSQSVVKLKFKQIANIKPLGFTDKFYFKDIKHIREQSQQSIVELRSHLLVLARHLSENDKRKLPHFMRFLTHNMPLVYGLKCLMRDVFMSQSHRIAVEEGLMLALADYIQKCTPSLDKLQYSQIFTYFRQFLDFILQGMKSLTNNKEIAQQEEEVIMDVKCYITFEQITVPMLIKFDNKQIVLVDKQSIESAFQQGSHAQTLSNHKLDDLFTSKELKECFDRLKVNQVDNADTTTLYWFGFKDAHPHAIVPKIGAISQYKGLLNSYENMKIYQPLQIKSKLSTHLILRNKEGKLRVFVGREPCSTLFTLFNVFTGQEKGANLDLMSANVSSQNVEEAIDISKLKSVISRDPQEAIVVLFDVSASMNQKFFAEKDLQRIGAVKLFFEAFAFRTIAYNFENVISLFFFNNKVQDICGFTEAFYDFNRLVSTAKPNNTTVLYDAIVQGVRCLIDFRKKYPNCIMRIIALTDGQDNGSKNSLQDAAKMVIENKIIIDSFVVGPHCDELKIISKASGGKCYLTHTLDQSLKLFEQETVLSVRCRKQEPINTNGTLAKRISWAKQQKFDLPTDVYQFKLPKIEGGVFSAQEILKKMEGSEESKKISSNVSLQRIAKEIKSYSDNPHPFICIYPCVNINLWKLMMLGPNKTPYQNGLFILYVQFPGSYPLKAPEVRFITPIYHCNVNSQGRICHSIFDRNYSPTLTFRMIIDCVYGLIMTPEPDDPLDNVIASFYLSDRETYEKKAKATTQKNANGTTQQLTQELFGKGYCSADRLRKEAEVEKWIKTVKSFN